MPKVDNVIFHTSDNAHDTTQYKSSFGGSYENAAYALQNGFRPRSNRPVCTHCGRMGHVIQKFFKLHGFPPGYIPGYKSVGAPSFSPHNQSFRPAQSFQPKGSNTSRPPAQAHAVANVVTDPYPYIPPPAETPLSLNLSQMNMEQIQSLIQQLSVHVKVPEPPAPSPPVSTITDHGIMAVQSISGNVSFPLVFPSTYLRFENHQLTFQHQFFLLYTQLFLMEVG